MCTQLYCSQFRVLGGGLKLIENCFLFFQPLEQQCAVSRYSELQAALGAVYHTQLVVSLLTVRGQLQLHISFVLFCIKFFKLVLNSVS